MNKIVLYKGKYGATRQYAEWLASSLQTSAYDVSTVDASLVRNADMIILGSAVYIGKLMISEWMFKNRSLLTGKKLSMFVVCGTPLTNKEMIDPFIQKNIPAELTSNLSLHFLRGRLVINNLSFKDKLLLKIGALVTKDPAVKSTMLKDFDDVKPENLTPLLNALISSTVLSG